MAQGGSAEVKAAWRPLPSKLTLLGIAYDSGSIRICTGALLELTHLSPTQLATLDLSAGGATAGPAGSISQVLYISLQNILATIVQQICCFINQVQHTETGYSVSWHRWL
jgi:hypothetical protein